MTFVWVTDPLFLRLIALITKKYILKLHAIEAKFLSILFNLLILDVLFVLKDWLSVDQWVQKHGHI